MISTPQMMQLSRDFDEIYKAMDKENHAAVTRLMHLEYAYMKEKARFQPSEYDVCVIFLSNKWSKRGVI